MGGHTSLRLSVARLLGQPLPPILSNLALRRLYPPERAKRDAHEYVVRSLTRSIFVGRSDDFHTRKFGVFGYSDWKLWAIALALCSEQENVVEAGANVGTETIGFADLLPGGRVFAFEPSPIVRQRLEQTLAAAGADNVEVLPFALGERREKASFAQPDLAISTGIGHLLGPQEARTHEIEYVGRRIETDIIEVETRTLDSLLGILPPVRLVCLDAEGAEPSILAGATRLVERDLPSIVTEAYEPHLRRASRSVEALHEQIAALGYEIFAIRRLSLVPLPEPEPGRVFDNWFCLHAQRAAELERVRRALRSCGIVPGLRRLNPLGRAPRKRRAAGVEPRARFHRELGTLPSLVTPALSRIRSIQSFANSPRRTAAT